MILARPIVLLAVFGVLLSAPALAASAKSGASGVAGTANGTGAGGKLTTQEQALLRSRELWATIDVCNPADQADTVGVRGSMPGDGQSKDEMYMRFRLQYLESTTQQWVDLANGADSGYVAVGAAKSARQTGRSFQLVPVAGKPAVELRGVVSFQWRRGATVEYTVSRPTTVGHTSLAGADPAGFSAAECSLS
ncbi:MAG TPA: hypothetical protein VFC30_01810 [Solirubrobacteraceae bacterium]|nr:hypothetical protein [Solirubrobacteraceae bacterium]